MIKVENIDIYGWEAAVRGMRNPMNSWQKSDSYAYGGPIYKGYELGSNDLDLMKRLAKNGSVHAKYRRMIIVSMDITAPLYWWKEFDTYKVGTVANSCSTMHKITDKEFTLDDFSCERLISEPSDDRSDIAGDKNLAAVDVDGRSCYYTPLGFLRMTCDVLNRYRKLYLETKDKKFWWQMIQLLPSSYNQRRTVQLNYEVLSHLYSDRHDHKLDEWREFCNIVGTLPYAKDLIIGGKD